MNNATLNRFFALHFVLPFVLAALALMHLIALHDTAGSSNPLGVSGNYDRLPFAPYFLFKDVKTRRETSTLDVERALHSRAQNLDVCPSCIEQGCIGYYTTGAE